MNEDIVGDKSLGYTVPSRLAETWQLMLAELSCRTAIAGTRQRCKGSGLGNDEFQRLWGFNEFQHIPKKMSHLGKQETTNKLVMFLQAFNVFLCFFPWCSEDKTWQNHVKTAKNGRIIFSACHRSEFSRDPSVGWLPVSAPDPHRPPSFATLWIRKWYRVIPWKIRIIC